MSDMHGSDMHTGDMHTAMANWAREPGKRVAQSLDGRDALSEARAGIARGRRRRAVGASASALVVVGSLVVAAAAVVPGLRGDSGIGPGVATAIHQGDVALVADALPPGDGTQPFVCGEEFEPWAQPGITYSALETDAPVTFSGQLGTMEARNAVEGDAEFTSIGSPGVAEIDQNTWLRAWLKVQYGNELRDEQGRQLYDIAVHTALVQDGVVVNVPFETQYAKNGQVQGRHGMAYVSSLDPFPPGVLTDGSNVTGGSALVAPWDQCAPPCPPETYCAEPLLAPGEYSVHTVVQVFDPVTLEVMVTAVDAVDLGAEVVVIEEPSLIPPINWSNIDSVVDAPFILGPGMFVGEALGDPMRCGAAWDYLPGAYAHTPEASEQVVGLSASARFLWDGDVLNDVPTVMTPEFSQLLWEFTYQEGHGGLGFQYHVASVAVDDGEVVGRGNIGGDAGGGIVSSSDVAPFPGECPELTTTELWVPYTPTDDGTYQQHLVIQLVNPDTFEPVATFIDPAGSFGLDYEDLFLLTQAGPGRVLDDGPLWLRKENPPPPSRFDQMARGEYSGLVVAATPGGCMAQREHLITVIGQGNATRTPVTLKDVDLKNFDTLGRVDVPAGEAPPWYVGEHAWLVVENGTMAKMAPYLEWTSAPGARGGTTWTLAIAEDRDGDPTVYGTGCDMTFEFIAPAGQAWIAISGSGDVPVTNDRDWETWVYVGEVQ